MTAAKRVTKIGLLVVGGLLLVVVAALVTVFVNGAVVAGSSAAAQEERLASLRATVAAQPGGVFEDWRESPVEDRVSWDRLQSIGTHNSYAVAPNAVQSLVLDLVKAGESSRLSYSHEPLWAQLQQGVRSVEFDLRVHADGSLRLTHVPVLANGSHSPDFRGAIEELDLWSASHPGHLPITILVEFKSDFAFLDPSLVDWSAESLSLVDEAVLEVFGDRLLAPTDVGVEPWPLVRDLRDRFMVIMHPNEAVEAEYASLPASGRALFVAADGSHGVSPVSEGGPRFVVHNDPDEVSIRELVDAGHIVRTRADADFSANPYERASALASGAQLVSTDFVSPQSQVGTGYTVRFDGGSLSRIDPARLPSSAELRHVDALDWVAAASPRELAGSVLMATIIGTNTDQLRSLMAESGLGGFILMGGNVPGSQSQLRGVTAALTLDPDLPPLIAIDEEGGVVKRLPWDPYPGANTLRNRDASAVTEAFAARAELLRGAGVNVNFGIVADVTADRRSFIYSRTLGNDAESAGSRVAAAVAGELGVVSSTLKHFPGHGAAPGDSHFSVPSTGMSVAQWRARDAVPFREGVDAGAELLMFGHLAYTSVTGAPATLAPEWYAIARDELGFTGVAITDDLSMLRATGLRAYRDVATIAVMSLVAGADMALVVGGMDYAGVLALVERVEAAVVSGELPEERLREAAVRVTELRLLIAERAAR